MTSACVWCGRRLTGRRRLRRLLWAPWWCRSHVWTLCCSVECYECFLASLVTVAKLVNALQDSMLRDEKTEVAAPESHEGPGEAPQS